PRVQRATSAGVARDGARPADSPFRRRWSRRTQVWVVIAAWPARRLGSWDRMVVPRPFARAALVLSAPLALPADRAAARAALEAALGEANAEAARAVGAPVA